MLENVMRDRVANGIEGPLSDAFSSALENLLGNLLGMDGDWVVEALNGHGPERSVALVSTVLRTSGHSSRPSAEEQRVAFISVASAIQRSASGGQRQTKVGSRGSDIHGV